MGTFVKVEAFSDGTGGKAWPHIVNLAQVAWTRDSPAPRGTPGETALTLHFLDGSEIRVYSSSRAELLSYLESMAVPMDGSAAQGYAAGD